MKYLLKIIIASIMLLSLSSCDPSDSEEEGGTSSPTNNTSFFHIGQHEAIVKVDRTTTQNLGFIVSKSTIAPDYETVKTLANVFYTREIEPNTPMYIYLSATDDTQYLRRNREHYLYVYDLNSTSPQDSVISFDFKTLSLPSTVTADTPEHFFDTAKLAIHPIGRKIEELFYIPLRAVRPEDVYTVRVDGSHMYDIKLSYFSNTTGDLLVEYLGDTTVIDMLISVRQPEENLQYSIGKYTITNNDITHTLVTFYEIK